MTAIFGFFFSSGDTRDLSSSSEYEFSPSLSSSSLPASSSLSGAPNALAGLVSTMLSLVGAAKLDSLGPEPPAKPFPRAVPKTLPEANPPNPEVGAPVPNAKPDAGLFPVAIPKPPVGTVLVVLDFPAAKAPNPEVVVLELPPKTLGFDAARVPNGEELDPANDAKPEFAKAEEDVCGLSVIALPNVAGFVASSAVSGSEGNVLDATLNPEVASYYIN